jgi:alpha-N-arabinofuranosidase
MLKSTERIAAGSLFAAVMAGAILAVLAASAPAEAPNRIVVEAARGSAVISRHVYGHFSEHLGNCIYGGIWVGENSPIANVRGIRRDVILALKKIGIPNLRWPGGCFADEYHWKNGIGPRDLRPQMVNTNWGGVTEDNSFGTHEFLDLCAQLECEPYITGNAGSGTVLEMSQWIEYMNFTGRSPMADWRRANGRELPWEVRFFGVGNEAWGCGGEMRAEYYSDIFRRYSSYCKDTSEKRPLFVIACGANGNDTHWTEELMKNRNWRMDGLSLHYYTVYWRDRGSASEFGEERFFSILKKAHEIDSVIRGHETVMDRYDPENQVALVVDEWGTWYDPEPGTNPAFLYQQNTMRDALVAALHFDIFNAHCRRVRMANIAQLVNVLQAPILTRGQQMVLTPTYHVFDLYRVHQDGVQLPLTVQCRPYRWNGESLPALSASASRDAGGTVHLSLSNIDPHQPLEVTCELRGLKPAGVQGRILAAAAMNARNTFEDPRAVAPADFFGAKLKGNILTVSLPPLAVVTLSIK